ncbi:hypothetical protein [Streptomyces sp. NRRL S-350]|uniref:hypothetical protein n=1 Tax=Streptomyces sp. NRRL S-350 TaxID=1463902 RepID=UPI0004C10103|nr:hypothetical protein [Streptomyces sp. NRRL S-350]
MTGVLGCPQQYSAVIHWRGGSRPFTSPGVSGLTGLAWNRTINDTSEAFITIAKGRAPDCCGQLGDIEPYIHELSIYRDGDLVWQGPVTRTVESRDTFRVEAKDVTEWLNRTMNTEVLRYVNVGDPAKPAAPVQQIAESIISLNVNNVVFSFPPDWCNIMPFIVRNDSATITRFEKDGSDDASIWIVPVLKIMNEELVPRGLEYTTVGRRIILGRPQLAGDRAQATLTLDHIAGDVEIIKDGASGSAIMWATNQTRDDLTDAAWGVSGFLNTPYGRLDSLVLSQAENMSGYDLLQLAQASQVGRYPVPIGLSVPNGSRLTSDAPVTIDQLVAGSRFNVITTGMCSNVTVAYRLTDVDVEWGDSGEQVAVSFVPLGNDPAPPTP